MQKLKVHFYVKGDKKKNGVCPIYGKISVGTSSATFSTGKTIQPARWERTNGLRGVTKLANEESIKNYLQELPRLEKPVKLTP